MPELKYKPKRDIPLVCRELNTTSPIKISMWLLRKYKVKRTAESVRRWLKRHPEVKEELEREMRNLKINLKKDNIYISDIDSLKKLKSCDTCPYAKVMEQRERELMKERLKLEEDKRSIVNSLKKVKSCDTCVYAKETIEEELICMTIDENKEIQKSLKKSRKTFCIKVNKLIKFRKLCVNHKAISCINCLYLIELIYVDEIFLKKGENIYFYYDIWDINCEKYGLMKNIRVKSKVNERKLPKCSLWKWKGEKETSNKYIELNDA